LHPDRSQVVQLSRQIRDLDVFGAEGHFAVPHDDDRYYSVLAEHMELRHFPEGEYVFRKGTATPPALYVVVEGTCRKEEGPPVEGGNIAFRTTTQSTVQVFGEELLERAEFRKTAGGKLLQSLVDAPYGVRAHTDCRCAVLTAVACREALRETIPDDYQAGDGLEEEHDDDDDEEEDEEESEETESSEGEDDTKLEQLEREDPVVQDVLAKIKNKMTFGGTQGKSKLGRSRPPPLNIFQDRLDDDDIDGFVAPVFEKTKSERHLLEDAMKDRPMLRNLPETTRDKMTAAFEKSKVKAGKDVVRRGDVDDFLYVVKKGECEVVVSSAEDGETKSRTLKAGDAFGDEALTTRLPRDAAVKAKTDAKLFKLDHDTYRRLVAKDMREDRQHKLDLLSKVDFLHNISTENREKLVSIMEAKKFRKGDVLCHKEESGKTFFLIDDGEVLCRDASSKLRGERDDCTLKSGEHFGQHVLASVRDPVKAELVVSKSGTVYKIDREQYRKVIGTSLDLIPVEDRTLGLITALQRTEGEVLLPDEILKLSHCIHNTKYKEGAVIVEAGVEIEAAIYIVREGEAHSTEGGASGRLKGRMKNILRAGTHFGDKLFMEAREADEFTGVSKYELTAHTKCVVGVISITDYYDVMSDTAVVQDAKAKAKAKKKPDKATAAKGETPRQPRWPKCDVELSDLDKLVCLGQGNFGQVWLVSEKTEKKLLKKPCALKIQSKHHLIETNQVKVCIDEKHLLQNLRHPFVVDLVNAYQDSRAVYMLLEYLPGGELYMVLNPLEGQSVLPEEQAKFYALCVADALAYIHSRNIIFRDLKPENVMIDRHGYAKIIDFGFAKRVEGKTFTLCGTPGYLAPEIVMNIGHGKAADHWQLGVLIYDMLSFESPFFTDDADQAELVRCVIEDPVPEIVDPGPVSPEAWDLILKLLEKDPKHRLGSLKRGERDILRHKWFQGLSLTELRKKTIQPPWAPDMSDPYDTSNFDDWGDLEDVTTGDVPNLTPEQAKMFVNF